MNEEHPRSEARSMMQLVRNGVFTIEAARAHIGRSTIERRLILRQFDLLCSRESRCKTVRLSRPCSRVFLDRVAPSLKVEIAHLWRSGLTHAQILRRVPVGPKIIWAIRREIAPTLLNVRGRGRRILPELREQIFKAVRAGKKIEDIQREFQVDCGTVRGIRRAAGDFRNLRHRQKLSPRQIKLATAMLRRGGTWRETAARFGVDLATLRLRVTYRKRG